VLLVLVVGSGAIPHHSGISERGPKPTRLQSTYLLQIPNWVLAWHLTLAALQASQALVMRGARGAAAGWGRASIVSMLGTCFREAGG
jgi:hypothetical protein